ncbi:hypothetical protein QTP86_031768, partial [Hemibagrus guttatus]
DSTFFCLQKKSIFKEQFGVVELVEYVLSKEENRSFQSVPILESSLQALTWKEIWDFIFHDGEAQSNNDTQYRALSDGIYYKTNELFFGEYPTIAIILYVDDFEICNPLGTSRKKHKVTAVYWVLADVPVLLRSSLTSIFLAIFFKAYNVKRFGYSTVLEPLLKDLVNLEQGGLYVPALGRRVKGTVFSVVADLKAPSMGGFVENFTGSYVCRFCLGEQSEFQVEESKYFTLDELNKSIKTFPYKWSDKSDAPQQVPLNFAAKKSVRGNAHENWSLLRLPYAS